MSALNDYRTATRIADEILSEQYATTLRASSISRERADAAIAELEAEAASRDAVIEELREWLVPVAGACPECGIDPAELAALKQLAHDAIALLMTPHVGEAWPVEVAEAVTVLRRAEEGGTE